MATDGDAHLLHAHQFRRLISNVVAWIVIAVSGALFLAVLRNYGTDLATRYAMEDRIQGAAIDYDRGDVERAEAVVLQVLRESPSETASVIEVLENRLLGMPGALEVLHGAFDAERAPRRTAGLYFALMGDRIAAEQALAKVSRGDRTASDSTHWLAEHYLEQGNFARAKEQFEAYWRIEGDGRTEAVRNVNASVRPQGNYEVEQATRLFAVGLWPEAFRAIEQATSLESKNPDHRFLEAVRLDLAGRRDEAIAGYRDVLAVRPSHLFALKRLQFLRALE